MSFEILYKKYLSKSISKKLYIKKSHQKLKILFEIQKFLSGSDVREIIIKEKKIIFKILSCEKDSLINMILDQNDSRFIPIEIFNFKKYESDVANFIYFIARKSRNIIDIGANIGWYSLNFNLIKNVKSIHAFEAIPRNFKFLQHNVKINNSIKIIPNNIALSDSNGKSIFFWTKKETGSASMRNNQNRRSINKILCKTNTLDNYINKKKLKIDLIKCDVEGSELLVFKGSYFSLKKYKPVVFTEMLRKWSKNFGYHPNEIINFFNKINYSCYAVKKKRGISQRKFFRIKKITNATIPTNFFFLHNTKHQNLLRQINRLKT
jgi:FkbM family methyltransferase